MTNICHRVQDPRVLYLKADITKLEDLLHAFRDIEAVFHVAALVGPYHAHDAYEKASLFRVLLIGPFR